MLAKFIMKQLENTKLISEDLKLETPLKHNDEDNLNVIKNNSNKNATNSLTKKSPNKAYTKFFNKNNKLLRRNKLKMEKVIFSKIKLHVQIEAFCSIKHL